MECLFLSWKLDGKFISSAEELDEKFTSSAGELDGKLIAGELDEEFISCSGELGTGQNSSASL